VNDPFSSRLILQDGPLDALAIGQLRLNGALVILSACNAGQRALDDRGLAQLPGDDMFGLQAAFFDAGATAVIGALWPLFDFIAVQLMTELHAGLATEIPADIALQNALVSYLKRPNARRNVFFWAPIFLSCIGL
jgi:CHAT domain-containing protein